MLFAGKVAASGFLFWHAVIMSLSTETLFVLSGVTRLMFCEDKREFCCKNNQSDGIMADRFVVLQHAVFCAKENIVAWNSKAKPFSASSLLSCFWEGDNIQNSWSASNGVQNKYIPAFSKGSEQIKKDLSENSFVWRALGFRKCAKAVFAVRFPKVLAMAVRL